MLSQTDYSVIYILDNEGHKHTYTLRLCNNYCFFGYLRKDTFSAEV